jgi:hypothetical protein
VPAKLGDRDTVVTCEIKGWLTGIVPAILVAPPSETKVQDIVARAFGNVAVSNIGPWFEKIIQRHLCAEPLVIRSQGRENELGITALKEFDRSSATENWQGCPQELLEAFWSVDLASEFDDLLKLAEDFSRLSAAWRAALTLPALDGLGAHVEYAGHPLARQRKRIPQLAGS